MSKILTAGSGWSGKTAALGELTEQENERAYQEMMRQGAGITTPDKDPIASIERDITRAAAGAEDISVEKDRGIEVNRRLHNAKRDYEDAVRAAGGDGSRVPDDIIVSYQKAEAAHTSWLTETEIAAEHNEKNARARALAEAAPEGGRTLGRMIRNSARSKRAHYHAVFNRGEVVEHKPPEPVAADYFDVGIAIGEAGKNRIAGAGQLSGYSEQPIIYCPEDFHGDVVSLISRAAFWQAVDGQEVSKAYREAGGAYDKLSRAVASTDS